MAAERARHLETSVEDQLKWFSQASGSKVTCKELADGVAIAKYVNCQLPNSGSVTDEQKLANVEELLLYLRECGVNLIGVQAADVVAGNASIIGGFLFVLKKFVERSGTNFVRVPGKEPAGVSDCGSSSPEITNLRSLYSAGFIGDEEFKRRLAELGGATEAHDSFKCQCQARQCTGCGKLVKECCNDDHQEMCSNSSIQCPVCQQTLQRSDLSKHLQGCRVEHSTTPQVFDMFSCQWCNEKMSVSAKDDHDVVCLSKTHTCPMAQWGCTAHPSRQELFSHIMECRKNFTNRNDFNTSTCDYCGAIIAYTKEPSWESFDGVPEPEQTPKEKFEKNEDIGGHYCPKHFVCPLAQYGCEFTCNERAQMIKHIETDCLNNEVECNLCHQTMPRSTSNTHKCCDFARVQVGVKQLEMGSSNINHMHVELEKPRETK